MGNHYRKSLFYEMYGPGEAKYSLKDRDHIGTDGKTYPSLYKLYMELGDLTEYEFANKYLEGWHQWTKLLEAGWFKPYINRWRTELELKLKAEALRRILDEAREGGKNSYQANKFFVEKGYIAKESEPSRRGRPTKAEIARRAAEEVFSSKQIDEDIKRLGGVN